MAQISRDLRNENRIRLFELLQTSGPISRAELSRKTGISGPTVMRIIDEFLEIGVVCETPMQEKSLGRRPVGISICSDFAYTASVLHEGDWIQAGIMNMNGQMCLTEQFRAERNFESVIRRQIPEIIDGMLERLKFEPQKLAAIGIGLPAVLDPYDKIMLDAPLIGMKDTTDISQWLEELSERYQAMVSIENDVNVMALGEHTARQLEDRADMAYIALGTGVGSGLILRGELRHGKNNMAGEIGYMLTPSGEEMETLIGLDGLEKRFGIKIDEELTEEQRGEIISYMTEILSPLLVNYAMGIDLDLIVLGGHTVSVLGEGLVDSIRERVEQISRISLSIESGLSAMPGIEGLGDLMRGRFNRQMGRYGLDILKDIT